MASGHHRGCILDTWAVASEIMRRLRVTSSGSRHERLFGSWISESKVLGTPWVVTESEGGSRAGGGVRPAA